jgi:hypothetical protein
MAALSVRAAAMPLVLETHRAGSIWTHGPQSYLDDLSKLEANTVKGQPVFLFPDKGAFIFSAARATQ